MDDWMNGMATWNEYEIGEEVFYWDTGRRDRRMTKGTIIWKGELPGFSYDHYIIKTDTEIEPLLAIRSGFVLEMSRNDRSA